MNLKKIYIYYFILIFSIQYCFSQTVVVPDANFRLYLQTNFPSVMVGPLLDTVSASSVTGTINCRAKSISSVSGIQYFKQISNIIISNNTITALPALNNFINLKKLYCDTNLLTGFPPVNNINTLVEFSCKNNKVISLPPFTGMINLTTIICSQNNITVIPSLTSNTSITWLDFSENQLIQLPDLSTLVNLKNLYCSSNKIKALPSLNNLINLKLLYCGNNLLTSLQILSQCTLLKVLRISGNQISQLPDLSFLNAPIQVYLDNNNLTFDDLLPIVNSSNYSAAFKLFPQNKFGNYPDTLVKKGGVFNFNLGIDGSLTTNSYKWFKNGSSGSNTANNLISVSNINISDTGSYYAIVKNSHPAFVNDSLVSNLRKLRIIDCSSSGSLNFTYSNISCQEGYRVTADASKLYNVTPPFTYVITNVISGENILSSFPVFSGIKEGSYLLTLRDALSCESYPTFFEFVQTGNCDPVFSPNGDGIADSYYISIPGKARIFNKNGDLVQELATPAYWTGSDKNGNEMPSGYYVIIMNETTTTNVSLMK